MKTTLVISTLLLAALGLSAKAGVQMNGLGFVAPQVNDKASVANPQPGELLLDTSDNTFYGRDSANNWISLNAPAGSFVPSGVIMPYAGSAGSTPSGYLPCDGAAVSRTTYAALFATIGVTYGAGDGSTTFNIPDLRGVFVRGAGSQTIGSVTYTGTLAAKQGQSTKLPTTPFTGVAASAGNHTHPTDAITGTSGNNYSNTTGGMLGQDNTSFNDVNSTQAAGAHTHTVSINGGGDSETRPANIALNYIIKY